MPQIAPQVVTLFASALDREDYAALSGLLADDCEYVRRNGVLRGPADIVDSYRAAAAVARRLVNRIQYESTIRRESGGQLVVTFIDHLETDGLAFSYSCEQIVTADEHGRIYRIEHRELPGQREALRAFLEARSVNTTDIEQSKKKRGQR